MPAFTFYGYTVRSARIEDLPLAVAWMSADPWHRDDMAYRGGEFWIEQRPGVESFVVLDKAGPLAFFQVSHVGGGDQVRLYAQFPPRGETAGERAESRCRISNGLLQLVPLMEKALAGRGVKAVFFVSRSADVLRFMRKRLGFTMLADANAYGTLMAKGI